jgi:hypothetical protein
MKPETRAVESDRLYPCHLRLFRHNPADGTRRFNVAGSR